LKLAFITEGSLRRGIGHVLRSLTLARELNSKCESHFLIRYNEDVIKFVERNGFPVFQYKENDELLKLLEKLSPTTVVIDKLNVGSDVVRKIKNDIKSRIVIFDNVSQANRYADVVVNAIIGSNFKNRKFFDKNAGTLYFYGPRYLILRRDFYKYKKMVKDFGKKNKIRSILIIFGGSDPLNFTAQILSRLLNMNLDLKIDVILGPLYKYHTKLKRFLEKNWNIFNMRVRLHQNSENVAELMWDSDVIFTSPGLSMFEALFLNRPVIVLYQNSLQKMVYRKFLERASNMSTRTRSRNYLLDLLHALKLNEAYIIDPYNDYVKQFHIGKGKFEILEAVTNSNLEMCINESIKICLRQVTDNDLELLFAWRSNPFIYRYFYVQRRSGPLKWEEHLNWWESRENRIDWIIYMHDKEWQRAVGSVNVTNLDTDTPEVGVYVGEITLWGRGVGKNSVFLVMDWLKKMKYNKVIARIMKKNIRSVRLFESIGFRRVGEARSQEWLYTYSLDKEKNSKN
jgi:spore coat polysaccharide biosynthesis predicted glycosyltransferase SpsG/RimJ/RimL family protein N-acetyltransferase